MKPAVAARRLSKRFDHVIPRYNTILGRLRRRRAAPDAFTWALREVSFEVERGECFGISGPNGAGKSTLLGLIAGILEPSAGSVEINGRTNAFLSLHDGLQPELSVLDNIEICGILMGLRRREILRRREAILDFAELSDRSELRMAELSAGQAARVAFSTAVHSELDILLVDETLSVGDGAFQSKCERAFARLRQEGKTMLVASHDEDLLRRACSRRLSLRAGRGEALTVSARPSDGTGVLRVLFIGNSHTQDVPGLLLAMSRGAAPRLEVETVVESGQTLEGHWLRGRAARVLSSGRWDHVVLQENSSRPILNGPAALQYARLFDEQIKKSGARTIVFMTWARPDYPHSQLAAAYRELGRSLGATVAPVGAAWAKALEARAGLGLYAPDQSHAGPLGAYLAARIFFGVLFGDAAPDFPSSLEGVTRLSVAQTGPLGGTAARPEELRFLDSVARSCMSEELSAAY